MESISFAGPLRPAVVVVLAVLVCAQAIAASTPSVSAAPQTPSRAEKGVALNLGIVLNHGEPSVDDLREAGFTLVGTDACCSDWFTESQVAQELSTWITAVHAAGLRAMLVVGSDHIKFLNNKRTPDPATATQIAAMLTQRSISLGADVVDLDELIVNLNINESQLQQIVNTGLRENPQAQLVITEYSADDLTEAYAWTSSYASVRVASDNYSDMSRIDFVVGLGLEYQKRPLTWLIFINPSWLSQEYDCYANLDSWMAYVKQKNVDVMFWMVDYAGVWKGQWNKVAAFAPGGTSRLTVYARSASTHTGIDSASVYLDGAYVGMTDPSGRLAIQCILPGIHELKITRDGFQTIEERLGIRGNTGFIIFLRAS